MSPVSARRKKPLQISSSKSGKGKGQAGRGKVKRPHFRFEDLEIWQLGKELSVRFHKVADNLEQRKLYRYAEQIRAAGLSVPNNIAEGSGSLHPKEFR